MAVFNKYPLFVDYLAKGGVNLNTDVLKVMLTNVAPVPASQAKYADISSTELAAGNGYTTGGATVTGTNVTNNAGTESLNAATTTFTSNTGTMGPFRYAVYYDSTANNQPLIGYYDYGSSISLNGAAGETFVLNPNGVLLTLA